MLALKVETTMPMKPGPGTYHLRTEANRHEEWYDTHLELTQLLKKENLISCKFRYKTLAVPGTNRPYEVDRIELDQEGLTRIKSDTSQLEISWYNPDLNYQGSYFIVVRDYYNQGFIDVIEAKGDKAILYPGRYGHRHMYYSIIARNCRASLRYKIEVLSDNAVSSRHFTNFIEFESH